VTFTLVHYEGQLMKYGLDMVNLVAHDAYERMLNIVMFR